MGVRPTGGSTMGRPVPKPAAQSPVAIGPGTAPTAQRTAREAAAKVLQGSGNNPQNAPYRNVAPRPTQSMDNYVRQDAKIPIKPLGPNAKVSDPGPNAKASLGKGYDVNARTQNLPVQGRNQSMLVKGVKPLDTNKKVTPSTSTVTPMITRKPAQQEPVQTSTQPTATNNAPAPKARPAPVLGSGANLPGSTTGGGTPESAFVNKKTGIGYRASQQGLPGGPSGQTPERSTGNDTAAGSSGNDKISKAPTPAAVKPRPRPQARPAAPAKETTGDIMNRMWVKESFESFLRNNFLKG